MRCVNFVCVVILIGVTQAGADDKGCLGCHPMIQAILSKNGAHPAMASGCGTCHVDHTQPAGADRSRHYLTSATAELCIRCHAAVAQKDFVHEPAKKDCTLCHDPHANLKDGLRAQSNALCLECHSETAKSKFETDGDVKLFGGRVTLTPHYFENLQLLSLKEDRGHPVSNHPVLRQKDAAWPEVSCRVCHKPHGANRSVPLLVTETDDFAPLCQRCHK